MKNKRKFEVENLARIVKIFAQETSNQYSSQDGKMAVIEAKIKDSLATLRETIKLLPSTEDSTISQKIKTTIETTLNHIQENPFLKLIDVSGDPAALLHSQSALPDPAGILGMHSDESLHQHRRGTALVQEMVKKSGVVPPQNNIIMQQPIGPVSTNNLDLIQSLINIRFDGMSVPAITPENYNKVITEAMSGQHESIVTAYRDAVMSMLKAASIPGAISTPDALIQEAQAEFCQNVRLLVIKAVVGEISNTIFTIGAHIQDMPGGVGFNLASLPLDETQAIIASLSTLEGKAAREVKQYNVISTSSADMDKTSQYLSRIIDAFDRKLSANLTPEGQKLALIFGMNPDARPTTKSFGPPESYPTLLHEAAINGDAETAALAIKMGANPNSLVKPMPNWSHYYYDFAFTVQTAINWFKCVPTPSLEGKTPLLYAAQGLVSNKNNQAKYLKTVLTIADSGGNFHIYNETGTSPYGVLSGYAELNNPSDGQLLSTLRGKQQNLNDKSPEIEFASTSSSKFDDDRGGGAVAIIISEESTKNDAQSKIEWINNIDNAAVKEYLLSLDSTKNMEKMIAEHEDRISGPRRIDFEIKKPLPESENSFLSKYLFLGCIAIKTVLSQSHFTAKPFEGVEANDIGVCALAGAIPTILSDIIEIAS